MTTPVERSAGLRVGTVEAVSPNEIQIVLELDAPQATALNAGFPVPFPRLNGYVLIPRETGAVVGVVTWLGVERSPFPKRIGLKDFGLVDLPFPLRRAALTPVGTLTQRPAGSGGAYRLDRGVFSFPSVGDPVLIPTAEQLRSIVEPHGANRRVAIGTALLAAGATVAVDPDKLFGRHLAVLGNTGSGKSCSVAGLIRWSLGAANEATRDKSQPPNARFIVLDPNGEYASAFADLGKSVRVFRVAPAGAGASDFQIAAWMWNSSEWATLSAAAPLVQRPLLLRALRDMRSQSMGPDPATAGARNLVLTHKMRFEQWRAQGATAQEFRQRQDIGGALAILAVDASRYSSTLPGAPGKTFSVLAQLAGNMAKTHTSGQWFTAFAESDLLQVLDALDKVISVLPPSTLPGGISEDAPAPFDVEKLAERLQLIAHEEGTGQAAQFVAMLAMRIRMMLADTRLKPVISPEPAKQLALPKWLEDYIGADGAKNGQVTVLDLSLVPAEIIHTVIAVLGRVMFEALQRYRRLTGQELPTVLVLEEAHTFVQRAAAQESEGATPTNLCRHVFERIAREGRKFGLGLVLSSQRPSELSPTVLAQCNSFLLHRLVNDRDQELVSRLVPDNLGGLLKDLPSLPTQRAILLGWATPVPVLVEMKELRPEDRPRSQDPQFWEVWTGSAERRIDWKKIADDWLR